MKKVIIIEIIKASKANIWYQNKVGLLFETIESFNLKREKVYEVMKGKFVYPSDCKVVNVLMVTTYQKI